MMDATVPTDQDFVSTHAARIREDRAQINILGDAIASLGYNTGFTLIVDAAYSVLSSDSAIIADATSNPIAVNLPLANSVYEGHQVKVKKSDAGASVVTVWRQSSDTIDNGDSVELTLEGESACFVSNGVDKWYKFN
jgi:hypothetical protein